MVSLGHTYVLFLKIRFRANGIRSRENGLIFRANGIRSRENGLIIRAVSTLDFVFSVNLENWTYSTHYFSMHCC